MRAGSRRFTLFFPKAHGQNPVGPRGPGTPANDIRGRQAGQTFLAHCFKPVTGLIVSRLERRGPGTAPGSAAPPPSSRQAAVYYTHLLVSAKRTSWLPHISSFTITSCG